MQSFQYKDEEGNDMIIVNKPKLGKIIEGPELEEFFKILKEKLDKGNKKLDFTLLKDRIKINKKDSNLMKGFIDYLLERFSENLIVEQQFKTGPSIRHRPLFFELDDNDDIVVKYTTLGKFNSFDNMLTNMSSL